MYDKMFVIERSVMTKEKINYSIIIPSRNLTNLLRRCLDSIPHREDVQIIVVDDNSDPTKVDFNNYPGLNEPYTDVIFSKEGKGAGYARNVGLKAAKGKWLLFADSDDYYVNGFLDVLDQYVDNDADIIYFGYYKNYNVDTMQSKHTRYDAYIEDFLRKPSSKYYQNNLKYGINAPWNKVFRREFIEKNGLTFEEIFAGNDIRFVHTAGSLTGRIAALPDKLYYYVKNLNSITHTKVSYENLVKRTHKAAAHIKFIQDQGAWNLAAYSWPSLTTVYTDYGIKVALKIFVLKMKLYRPLLYVKLRAKLMVKTN